MDRQELRERRRRLGLTQAQLGEALGVTARAVGKWEAGDAPITDSIDLATRYLLEHPKSLKHERDNMRMRWFAAAMILVSGAAVASDRPHLREGAIMCPNPSDMREAQLAASRGDTPWFRSTGCSQLSGKPEIAVITDLRTEPLTVIWRVRVLKLNVTAYVGSWDVEGSSKVGAKPADFNKLLKHLENEDRSADGMINLIKQQLVPCWRAPAGARDAKELTVRIRASVNPDGTVQTALIDVDQRRMNDPLIRAAAESARSTFFNPQCTPLHLPSDKYEVWKNLDVTFDPRDLL